MEAIGLFLAEYWFKFFLGLLATGLGSLITVLVGKIKKRYKAGRKLEKIEEHDEFLEPLKTEILNQVDEMAIQILGIIQEKDDQIA